MNPRDEVDVNINVIASYRKHQVLISNSYETKRLLEVFPEKKVLSILKIFEACALPKFKSTSDAHGYHIKFTLSGLVCSQVINGQIMCLTIPAHVVPALWLPGVLTLFIGPHYPALVRGDRNQGPIINPLNRIHPLCVPTEGKQNFWDRSLNMIGI